MLEASAFALLQGTLLDSRNLNLCYFESLTPQTDLRSMDCGIRGANQEGEALYEVLRKIAMELSWGVILILKDRLRLTTILFRDPNGGLYTVGPFRSLPYEEGDYAALQQKSGSTASGVDNLKLLIQSIPCNILRAEAVAVAKNILLTGYGFQDPTVEELDLDTAKIPLPDFCPPEDSDLRMKAVERTYQFEEMLMQAISAGDEGRAMECVQYFTSSNLSQREPYRFPSHVQSLRSYLSAANTLFRKAAQTTGIHPVFLDEISRRFAQHLSLCATQDQLNAVYMKMIYEYCQLCREQTTKGFSPNIQAIMHYVQFHFSEDLSPESIAEAVHFSPNYVSRRFREETGRSLMAYVTQCRVRKAQELLTKTTMTVREIANYVGIPDWNYFTKIFKKETGKTPSEYRVSPSLPSRKKP